MEDQTLAKFFADRGSLYYIDQKGEVAIDASEYLGAQSFSGGLAAVEVKQGFNGMYGFIDRQGKLAVEPAFFAASAFSDGLACVQLKERRFYDSPDGDVWGYIDTGGQVVIEGDYAAAYSFSEGIAIVRKAENFFFIDKKGRKLATVDADAISLEYSGDQKFSDGLIAACEIATQRYGFMDVTGKFVIKPQFHDAANFSEGLAPVCVKKADHREYMGAIDRKGDFVIDPVFDIDSDFRRGGASGFAGGLAAVVDGTSAELNFLYIDRSGNVVLRTPYFFADRFSQGLAAVFDTKTERWGFIDRSGELVLPAKYRTANPFSEGLAVVRR